MPCDLTKHKRRLLWEPDLSALAKESAAIGFVNADACSVDYWGKFDQQQSDPDFFWLDGGKVFQEGIAIGGATGIWVWSNTILDKTYGISLKFFGIPGIETGNQGQPISIACVCDITVFQTTGPTLVSADRWDVQLLAPSVDLALPFPGWKRLFPIDTESPIIGTLTFTPLARCHDCTDD